MSKKVTYQSKIKTITSYFGISDNAAKYIYHRRRRGFPWKKNDESSYIAWSMQLQNALIQADNLDTFDWGSLKFGEECRILLEHDIDIETQPKSAQTNKIHQVNNKIKETGDGLEENIDDNSGWTVVTSKKGDLIKKHLIRSMGLLPAKKSQHDYKKHKRNSNPLDEQVKSDTK